MRTPPGDEVWRWSYDKAFATIATCLHLEPGQTIDLSTTWSQLDNLGRPVARGSYSAEGLVPTQPPGSVSDDLTFRIR